MKEEDSKEAMGAGLDDGKLKNFNDY